MTEQNSTPDLDQYRRTLRFLRSCYEANAGSRVIADVFGSKVDSRFFLARLPDSSVSESLVESDFVRSTELVRLGDRARAYETEMRLIFAALFAVGEIVLGDEGKRESIAAPLVWFKAEITTDEESTGGVELQVDPTTGEWNEELIDAIAGGDFLDRIERNSIREGLTEGFVGSLRQEFEKLPNVDASRLLDFPHLARESELRQTMRDTARERPPFVSLVPAASVLLTPLGPDTRGILSELAAMAEKSCEPSPPLRALFFPGGHARDCSGKSADSPETTAHEQLPASLSNPQADVLDASRQSPLSACIGPPGTGKSFTIATMAIEAALRGESVLIASKKNHAVDVVADKIAGILGTSGLAVRAGRRKYARQLREFLDDALNELITADYNPALVRTQRDRIHALSGEVAQFRQEIRDRIEREEEWAAVLQIDSPRFFQRLRRWWLRRKIEKESPVAGITSKLLQSLKHRRELAAANVHQAWVNQLEDALASDRTEFLNLRKALRARTSSTQREIFENTNLDKILAALPIWMVNLSDAYDAIPMKNALFDLVIFDESSQCDSAAPLPLLQRAGRAVFFGDPKQLRHVSFLANERQRTFAETAGLTPNDSLDFRNHSILDLVLDRITDQSCVSFLNEHFRSQPEIISFSNDRFYRGKLKIMTALRNRPHLDLPVLRGMACSGRRDESGINEIEAEAVVAHLRSLVRFQTRHDRSHRITIGILSPFRAQVDFLRERTEAEFPNAIDEHDLIVGTSHSFQGEERDVMLVSLCLDKDSHPNSFRYLETAELFNVAITRARFAQTVFHSFNHEDIAASSNLATSYLHSLNSNAPGQDHPSPPIGAEASAILDQLKAHSCYGIRTMVDIAGTTVDIVFEHEGSRYGLDLVDFPGITRDSLSLERLLSLDRAGLPVFPLTFSEWLVAPARVLESVLTTGQK